MQLLKISHVSTESALAEKTKMLIWRNRGIWDGEKYEMDKVEQWAASDKPG